MIDLPALPKRIARLPKDERGYPVPWFVAWMYAGEPCPPGQGEPDFRIIGPGKLWTAYTRHRCWVCGDPLGQHKVYVIGPMCVINRVTSEPPSHRECAEFAAIACPFLTRPRQKRDKKDMPEETFIAGNHIDRNPGAVCLYETSTVKAFRAGDGYLFNLGLPDRIDWYSSGRRATRAEIELSITTGYPLLYKMAKEEGPEAVHELERMREAAWRLLPEGAKQ